MSPSRKDCILAWRAGNDAGEGFAPGCGAPGDESIDGAVRAYVAEGATVVYERLASDEIAVVDVDGELIGVGGDAHGDGAWAVRLEVLS